MPPLKPKHLISVPPQMFSSSILPPEVLFMYLITEKISAFTCREQVISTYLIATSSLFIHQKSG